MKGSQTAHASVPRYPDRRARNAGLAAMALWMVLGTGGLALAEERLTDAEVSDLEAEVMDADPGEIAERLRPYLAAPDRRLSPILAEVLTRGDELPLELRNDLVDALLKIADERAFEPAQKLLENEDVELARRGAQLMGRTGHRAAAPALMEFYRSTARQELHVEVLIALGELGDRAALAFASQAAHDASDEEVRNEANMASVRLGSVECLKDILALDAALRRKIDEITVVLSWLSFAEPKTFRQRMRDLARMKGQVERIGKAFQVACRDHPGRVLELLMVAGKPEELDVFYSHADSLVASVGIEEAAQLADHPSGVLACRAMQALSKRGDEGQRAVSAAAGRLADSPDPARRERAMQLTRFIPSEAGEPILRKGLDDPAYRCREAALIAAGCLGADRRRGLLRDALEREQDTWLQDLVRWLLENPEARSALR
ncbi:MAG: HEAT repeat domain-containing protein [Planctomycetes bacterium]|nr:HEAT repeat domain-containing protein [Planctomycetota bacterium]